MIITRHILHSQMILEVDDNRWDRIGLFRRIDRAKSYLINEKSAQPGQNVVMLGISWPSYLIWFIACAELGMSFVVSDSVGLHRCSASVREKLSLYGDIDYVIGNIEDKYFRELPHLYDKYIHHKAWANYHPSSYDTPIWATRDSILIRSTTSGTTNIPKVCNHTHGFFYDLMVRNADVLNLNENDVCLHTLILHHGSVAGVYFLPSLYRCKRHRWCEHIECANTIQKYDVNRVLLFYDDVNDMTNRMIVPNKTMTLYVLSAVTERFIDHMVRRLGNTVTSIYGCTETSGPLMLSLATPFDNTNWDPLAFSGPLDTFYVLSVKDGMIQVMMPDGSIITPGDRFTMNGDKWILKGRENIYRIKGKQIYLGILASWLESRYNWKHQDTFDLVFDSERESIYLRINNMLLNSLHDLNQEIELHFGSTDYQITKVIEGARLDFYTGIKFDSNEVRLRCRG